MPITTPVHLIETYGGDADHFRHVLDELFIPAIEEAGMTPIAPIAQGSENIHAEVIEALQSADLVLVDLSSLNPNVFFEFGVRTSLNLPACPIRDSVTPQIPFDTSTLNTAEYNWQLQSWITKVERPKLAQHLNASLERSKGGNALWRHFGLRQVAQPTEAPQGIEGKLDALIAEVAEIRGKTLHNRPSHPFSKKDLHGYANHVVGELAKCGIIQRGYVFDQEKSLIVFQLKDPPTVDNEGMLEMLAEDTRKLGINLQFVYTP